MLIPAQSQPQSCDLGQTLQLDLSFAMHTMLSWLCYSGILSCRIGLLKAVWAFPGKCGWPFICLFGLWFLLLLLICLPCYYQCKSIPHAARNPGHISHQSDEPLTQECQTLTSIKVFNAEEGSQSCLRPCWSLRLEQVHTLLTDHDWSPVPSPNLEMDPTDGLRCKWHPPPKAFIRKASITVSISKSSGWKIRSRDLWVFIGLSNYTCALHSTNESSV